VFTRGSLRDRLPEDAALLCSRLADVYSTYQHDITKARALLMQVIETMPNTRHAANATHRLQEIERQLVMQGE
jgi:outer membrane protein assembly factor BamD (BamD/ComL family)